MPAVYPQQPPPVPLDGQYYAQPYAADLYGPAQRGWYGATLSGAEWMPSSYAAPPVAGTMNWGPFQPSHPSFYPAPPHPTYPYPAQAQPGLGDHRDDASAGGPDPYHGYLPPSERHARDYQGGGGGMFRRDRWQAPPQQQQQYQESGWANHGQRNGGSRSPSPAPYGDHAQQRDPAGRGAYYARQEDQFAAEGAMAGPHTRRGPRHGRYSQRSRRFPSEVDAQPGASAGEEDPHGYGFGFGGLQTASAAPAYGPDGTYIPPERRQRRDLRTAIVSPPTPTYLAAADLPSTCSAGQDTDTQPQQSEPVTLIMDLNHTLLCRAKRNRYASKMPVVRPYLSTFLTYICTTEPNSPDGESPPSTRQSSRRRKFDPIVYSSARAPNVLSMLAALNLIPPARLAALPFRATYEPAPEEGDVLRMVFTREMMGLSERDYHGDVETVKDLAKVWERLGWAGDGSKEAVVQGTGAEDAAVAPGEAVPEVEAESGGELTAGGPQAPETAEAIDGTPVEAAAPPKKLNKKAKLRRATKRDTTGASRTLLLDDEAGKAVRRPQACFPERTSADTVRRAGPATVLAPADRAFPPAPFRNPRPKRCCSSPSSKRRGRYSGRCAEPCRFASASFRFSPADAFL